MSFSARPLAALAAACVAVAPVQAAPKIGKPAPAFKATTMDQEEITLAALRGQVVVVNLWATWCGPCKREMPMMNSFYKRHKDKGFVILGVQTKDSVPAYKLKGVNEALAYPLAAKFRGGNYESLGGVPTTYVIDRKGVVRYAESGAFDAAEFNRLLLPLLAEPAP